MKALSLGGAVDLPDGPGGGAAWCRARSSCRRRHRDRRACCKDGVDHHAGILRAYRVIGLDLVVIHGAHVVLGYLGVEVGHGVACFQLSQAQTPSNQRAVLEVTRRAGWHRPVSASCR